MAGADKAKAYAELAVEMFNEGLSLIDKGDVVQSSGGLLGLALAKI